ncbi:hypothetical protein DRJ25_05495, partial [Candidatus Woesearchaeota archaeon]
ELVYKIDETIARLAKSPVPEILVEMMIVEWCGDGEQTSNGKRHIVKTNPPKADQPVAGKIVSEYKGSARELWRELVKSLNGEAGSFSLGALLAKAKPGMIQGDLLTIEVEYGFHRDQIMQEKHRSRIEELITTAVGQPMRIVCEVSGLQKSEKIDTIVELTPEADVSMDEAVEIFTS